MSVRVNDSEGSEYTYTCIYTYITHICALYMYFMYILYIDIRMRGCISRNRREKLNVGKW